MVCGAVRFDHPVARKLLAVLPRILTLDPATSPTQLEWLRSTLRLMALEAEGLRPGGETMITRLSDVLVVQALRAWLESDPAAQSGWLGALRDPQIGRAISLIHREPGRPWTVASLADQIPMSRSAFAARFTELVGEPARRNRGRTRGSFRLSLRGRIRTRVQARNWNTARCPTTGGAGPVNRRLTSRSPPPAPTPDVPRLRTGDADLCGDADSAARGLG